MWEGCGARVREIPGLDEVGESVQKITTTMICRATSGNVGDSASVVLAGPVSVLA